jgi:hypothetical protein
MYRHDPAVMLYAPLRTALCVGTDGRTRFVIDQPSTVFSSFGVPEITAVGMELDRKLVSLLETLGAPCPLAYESPRKAGQGRNLIDPQQRHAGAPLRTGRARWRAALSTTCYER